MCGMKGENFWGHSRQMPYFNVSRQKRKRKEWGRRGGERERGGSLSRARYPFPLKFSISSQPGCQAATINSTLETRQKKWIRTREMLHLRRSRFTGTWCGSPSDPYFLSPLLWKAKSYLLPNSNFAITTNSLSESFIQVWKHCGS